MNDNGLMAIMGDDGVFREYNDEFDITIHCQSQEEQEQVEAILNRQWISREDIEKIIADIQLRLKAVNIALDVLQKDDALIPKMEAARDSLEECLSIIAQYTQKETAGEQKTEG